ncbi:transmembrane gamma-carboxyglutamic acid protein 4 [Perca fluviatilis]|uniref:transmembrane gamma-carboxyglutamic acid protein 4 n=1 Tax=Perca fluviatilis TaxID=8168 RepID=UPI001963E183|nr:transmembrane gamma-carboxyglutamic acid protein 4 [Perca fluviatilis]
MLFHLFILLQLLACGDLACMRRLLSEHEDQEVFLDDGEKKREVFENIPATEAFWKKYTEEKDNSLSRVDVTSLLVGLIAGGVAIVIAGLLVWYLCHGKCKNRHANSSHRSMRGRPNRSNASLIMRRLEEVSLQPVPPLPMEEIDPPGLPSYEQAIAKSGPHDAPPPPYPGSQPGSIRR